MDSATNYKVEETADAVKISRRIAFIKNRDSVKVEREEKEMMMTFPNLVVKELIAFEVLVIILAFISLLFDAPLEWIANPDHTPNPAKAPWYFLGLQELLHYFPPVVAGVILPVLAVIALIVIPYFKINVKLERMWEKNTNQRIATLVSCVVFISVILFIFNVYAMLIPTFIVSIFMIMPYYSKKDTGILKWLGSRPLAWWIMTWFVIIVVILTAIGTLFRGPEWTWTWPWEGIY